MSTSRVLPVLCASAFILSGCASKVWYKPGADADQTRRDLAACKLLNSMNSAPAYNTAGLMLNSIEGGNFVHNCMEAKGYQLVKTSEVPATSPTRKLGNSSD